MINKIKLTIMALALLAVPVFSLAPQVAAQSGANIQDCLGEGASLDVSLEGPCTPADTTSTDSQGLNELVTTVVNVISIIVGVIAVIMIIWGGLKYITSGGESNKITAAKNTILYALIGLVVVALAQFIVRFVLGKATGVVDGA